MKTQKIIFQSILLSLFVFIIFSCSKDRVTPISTNAPVTELIDTNEVFLSSPQEVLERFTAGSTSKVINSADDMPFVGPKGTKIYAGDYDFRFPNGQYAAYPITLEIIELFTPKDMILNQMPTVSNGRLLTTAGEVNIKAYKDGQELKLSRWNQTMIEIPSTDIDPAMSLFYGNTQSDGTVNWVEAEFEGREGQDSSLSRIFPTKENYQIFPSQIGWINCDKFYLYTGPKTKIKFKSDKPDINSIVKFLYFENIKSVAQIYGEESLEVPVGEKVKVICIASKTNGQLYSYTNEFMVQNDQLVDVKLEKTTEAEFLAYLGSL